MEQEADSLKSFLYSSKTLILLFGSVVCVLQITVA